jgi:hypothetical protein
LNKNFKEIVARFNEDIAVPNTEMKANFEAQIQDLLNQLRESERCKNQALIDRDNFKNSYERAKEK